MTSPEAPAKPEPTYVLRGVLVPRAPDDAPAQGAAPSRGTEVPPPSTVESDGGLKRASQNSLLTSLEDGALAAGGLLAGVAQFLNDPRYVMFGLVFGAVGKAVPSVYREIRDRRARRSGVAPSRPVRSFDTEVKPSTSDPAWEGDATTRAADFLADALLLILPLGAAGLFVLHHPRLALLAVGLAFVLKACIDIGEDWYVASNPSIPGLKAMTAGGSSRGPESALFLVFGLSALALVLWPPAATSAAGSYVLSFGALGKALPSLLSSKSGDGGGAASGASTQNYDLYEVVQPPAGADRNRPSNAAR